MTWGRGPGRGEVEIDMAGAGRTRWEDGATSVAEGGAWSGGDAAEAVSANPQCPAAQRGSAPQAGCILPDSRRETLPAGGTVRLLRLLDLCLPRSQTPWEGRFHCLCLFLSRPLLGPGKWVQTLDLSAPENKAGLLHKWKP